MGLPLDIRSLVRSGNSIENCLTFTNRFKTGAQFEAYRKWVEIFWIEEKTLLGQSAYEILDYIRAHSGSFISHRWTANKIRRIQSRLNVIATPSTLPSGDYTISETRGFGVEIEMYVPYGHGKPISDHDHSLIASFLRSKTGLEVYSEQYNHNARNHWKIVTDGSLHGNGICCELVSPVLKGKDGLEQIRKISLALKQMKAKINASCGLHVHHGIKGLINNNISDKQVILNSAIIYDKYQNELNKILPRERWNAMFARPFAPMEMSYITRDKELISDRRRVVNMIQAYTRHGTVEFRQHSGTIEFEKIINWVIITQAIVERATQIKTNHNFADSYIQELKLDSTVQNYIKNRSEKLLAKVA